MALTWDDIRSCADGWLGPIPSPSPTGASVRLEPDYQAMEAEVAKTCAEGFDKLYAQMFFGQGAMCAGQQKRFRDKVQQLSTTMREPAGFREAQKKYGTQVLQDAFQASNVNYQLTAQTACDKAVGSKDYAFLGSGNCDENVKRLGPVHCQGRDYYLVDRSLIPL